MLLAGSARLAGGCGGICAMRRAPRQPCRCTAAVIYQLLPRGLLPSSLAKALVEWWFSPADATPTALSLVSSSAVLTRARARGNKTGFSAVVRCAFFAGRSASPRPLFPYSRQCQKTTAVQRCRARCRPVATSAQQLQSLAPLFAAARIPAAPRPSHRTEPLHTHLAARALQRRRAASAGRDAPAAKPPR